MQLPPRLSLLLHLIDTHPGATVVELTGFMASACNGPNPPSQQSIRAALKTLQHAGFAQAANSGRPRHYIRTPRNHAVQPADRTPAA